MFVIAYFFCQVTRKNYNIQNIKIREVLMYVFAALTRFMDHQKLSVSKSERHSCLRDFVKSHRKLSGQIVDFRLVLRAYLNFIEMFRDRISEGGEGVQSNLGNFGAPRTTAIPSVFDFKPFLPSFPSSCSFNVFFINIQLSYQNINKHKSIILCYKKGVNITQGSLR